MAHNPDGTVDTTFHTNINHAMSFLLYTLLVALSATRVTPLVAHLPVLERQTFASYNKTYVCQEQTFGGCCAGFDELAYGTGCTNATLTRENVGGSTFGQRNEYACTVSETTKSVPAQGCLCCKFRPTYNETTWNWEEVMFCQVGDLSPQ